MEKSARKRSSRKAKRLAAAPIMSQIELAQLGGGEVAYIRSMTSEEAQERFPTVEGLPGGIMIYALHAADGTPIALTDSRQAALSHAIVDELEVASVH